VNRAYSLLHIKAIDAERRYIRGIASTPEPDRDGDIIELAGVKFRNPLPLLFHHDQRRPIGHARLSKEEGAIAFEAQLATVDEPGAVKDRLDEAWHSIKAGLTTGASIGYRPLGQDAIELNPSTGGLKFLKTEIIELSVVTIPANAGATILTVKSLDQAASGRNPSGASELPLVRAVPKGPPTMKTVPDQIAAFEATRGAKQTRMTEIMQKSADDLSTLDAAETEEYDTLAAECKSIDAHLGRLHDLEKLNIAKATPIPTAANPTAAAEARGGNVPVITVRPILPKATHFTRFAMCLASSRGDYQRAMLRAESYRDTTPEVELMVKAAVAAGTTTDATWAGPLAIVQPLVSEFLELLRPRTLLGRVPGMRQVPFNVSVPSQTAGGTYGWVGQNKPKPVTKADYGTVTVGFAKAAGIIVLSEELVRLSTPSAEALVREEMIAGIGQFLDTQFVDPAVAAVANVNPASITNGAATAAASGVTGAAARADLAARVATFTAANIPLEGAAWLMNDSNAFGIGMSLNSLGQPLFPGFGPQGGSIMGIPVVISNNVGNRVILMHAPSILFADEGGVDIDVSREASVQMDSAPSDPPDATTVYVSLWQRNLVGLRAERMVNWIRARTAAVTYISAASYNGT
jgi:HK97 family phage major capsid protein/HK97 family phage prohead protease